MIKIFLTGSKMNAVDDKNNLVGFDTYDDCCAHGGWFVSPEKINLDDDDDELESHEQTEAIDYPEYSFDTQFFEDPNHCIGDQYEGDGGGLVRFRMVAEEKSDLYLHLYNCHNGYYSKGFEYSFGEIKKEGSL
jgi:hypothetical protein